MYGDHCFLICQNHCVCLHETFMLIQIVPPRGRSGNWNKSVPLTRLCETMIALRNGFHVLAVQVLLSFDSSNLLQEVYNCAVASMWIYSTLDRNFAKVSGETLNSYNLLKTLYLMDVGDRIGGFPVAFTEFQSCLFRKPKVVHHLAPDCLRQRLGLGLVTSLAAKKMLRCAFNCSHQGRLSDAIC